MLNNKIFSNLPSEVRKKIIRKEFQKESPFTYLIRKILEHITTGYVVTYKRDLFKKDIPPRFHLCGNINGAELSTFQLWVLQFCEKLVKVHNTSFAVYKKPIELISPPRFPDVK